MTVKFSIRGKTSLAKIYVRMVEGREYDFKVVTPLTINPDFFNNKTGKVRNIAHFKEKDRIQAQLNELETYIINQYNKDLKNGGFSSDWLKDCVKDYFNITPKEDLTYLVNYAKAYYERLPYKRNSRTGQTGLTKGTQQKYFTLIKKLQGFDKHKRKKHRITDINRKVADNFLEYLTKVENLNLNTAGRWIKFLKSLCLDAKQNGYSTNPELEQIKGFALKVDKIYLNFDELQKIEDLHLDNERLEIAKDWLIIGCYIGQRAGDLLSLTEKNLTHNGKLDFIEITQQKTNKKVSILIHQKVIQTLEKRGGKFPPIFCDNLESAKTLFNRYIKEVCRLAGLTEPTKGAKINPDTNRKETGIFPKWELVTSHICRRSFATNYYGTIPTALIMNVTGHATEKDFLNYIGKTNIDYAEQMAKYWNLENQRQSIREGEQTPIMRITHNKTINE